jgi:hypothetical protein
MTPHHTSGPAREQGAPPAHSYTLPIVRELPPSASQALYSALTW